MKNILTIKEGIPTVEVFEAKELNDYLIIDVRRPDEFNGELGHIKEAKLIPLGNELTAFLKKEPRIRKILFVCRSGNRSGKATLEAMDLGFTNVSNMAGGMIYWNDKNYPVQRGGTIKKNIHPVERVLRIVSGLILVSLAFVGPENKWFLLGLIPLITGLVGWCAPYQMLGINTAK